MLLQNEIKAIVIFVGVNYLEVGFVQVSKITHCGLSDLLVAVLV